MGRKGGFCAALAQDFPGSLTARTFVFLFSPRRISEILGRIRGLLCGRSEKATQASLSPKGTRREMGVKLIAMVDRNKI